MRQTADTKPVIVSKYRGEALRHSTFKKRLDTKLCLATRSIQSRQIRTGKTPLGSCGMPRPGCTVGGDSRAGAFIHEATFDGEKEEQSYKRDSVFDCHSSGPGVAAKLKRFYPKASRGPRGASLRKSSPSYLILLQLGFAKPASCPAAGGLLPHRFALTLPFLKRSAAEGLRFDSKRGERYNFCGTFPRSPGAVSHSQSAL